jgi:hypothetical protein
MAFWWSRRVISRVRARRGRDFLMAFAPECDLIDRRPIVYTEIDQAEDRRRVLAMDFGSGK